MYVSYYEHKVQFPEIDEYQNEKLIFLCCVILMICGGGGGYVTVPPSSIISFSVYFEANL